MRGTITRTCLGFIVAAAGIAAMASVATASEGVCSFTVAGQVEDIWCGRGPAPAPCYLVVIVPTPEDKVEIGTWCLDDLAAVCRTLERGMPVVVLGEDYGEEKEATHIAIWLEPSSVSQGDEESVEKEIRDESLP